MGKEIVGGNGSNEGSDEEPNLEDSDYCYQADDIEAFADCTELSKKMRNEIWRMILPIFLRKRLGIYGEGEKSK